jgi:hypothetical protein
MITRFPAKQIYTGYCTKGLGDGGLVAYFLLDNCATMPVIIVPKAESGMNANSHTAQISG